MTHLHHQEMGHFVHALSPEQRTFLQRVLGECLSAIPRSGQPVLHHGPEAIDLMQQAVEPLYHLMESLRCFEPADDANDIRPFRVEIVQPGQAVVVVHPRILSWRGIWDAQSHGWVEDLHLGRLVVDVSALHDLNSSTIAWLATLAGHLPQRRLILRGANAGMARSLRALRLDSTLILDQASA
jgi:anti-anti-sigma regulatory factor